MLVGAMGDMLPSISDERTTMEHRMNRRHFLASTPKAQQAALEACDFFLHGSGPGLVGGRETELARKASKPYGFAGVTLSDAELSRSSRA